MTDIDFDELDRAVNSLMQSKRPSTNDGVSERSPVNQSTEAAAKTPAASNHDEPKTGTSQPSVEKTTQPIAATKTDVNQSMTPSLSVNKRGKFMDVVRTPAESRQAEAAPKLAPRRTTTTLQPTETRESSTHGPRPAPSITSPQNLVSEPVKRPAPAARVDMQPNENTATQWPDPIETVPDNSQASTEISSPSMEPLNTPFLPDAKVDKRPLGGIQPINQVEAEPVSDPDITKDHTSNSDASSMALPAELSQDILAIEADAAKQSNPEPIEKIDSTISASSKPPLSSTPNTLANPAVSMPTNTTVGSLPQGPPSFNSNETTSHTDSSIFDTEQYQAPIKQPSKSKRSWLTVVAIIALVVLGTIGGVAFYLLSSGY